MKYVYILIAVTGFLLTLIPSILFYLGSLEDNTMKNLILTGAFLWFAGAIPWLGKKKSGGKKKTSATGKSVSE